MLDAQGRTIVNTDQGGSYNGQTNVTVDASAGRDMGGNGSACTGCDPETGCRSLACAFVVAHDAGYSVVMAVLPGTV